MSLPFAKFYRMATLASVLVGAGAGAGVSAAQESGLTCPAIVAVQGGGAICQTAPGATVFLDGQAMTIAADGWAFVGFRANAGPSVTLASDAPGAAPLVIDLAPQDYPVSRIDNIRRAGGVQYTPKELAHICLSSHLKRHAFDAPSTGGSFLDGFIIPSEGRRSGVYGAKRVYNNDDANPRTHWGIDVAAPVGTPVAAPAGGVVTLADPNLFFEGGTIFLDHGQGLVSVFMHLSAVDVQPGERVTQGQTLGEIGNTGRSTGPHLHWGVKYQDEYWIDPALLVSLSRPEGAGAAAGSGVKDDHAKAMGARALEAYATGMAACFEP